MWWTTQSPLDSSNWYVCRFSILPSVPDLIYRTLHFPYFQLYSLLLFHDFFPFPFSSKTYSSKTFLDAHFLFLHIPLCFVHLFFTSIFTPGNLRSFFLLVDFTFSFLLSLNLFFLLFLTGQLCHVLPTASNSIISLRSIYFQFDLRSLLGWHDARRHRVWLVRTCFCCILVTLIDVRRIDRLMHCRATTGRLCNKDQFCVNFMWVYEYRPVRYSEFRRLQYG